MQSKRRRLIRFQLVCEHFSARKSFQVVGCQPRYHRRHSELELEVLAGNELFMLSDEQAEYGIDNVDKPDITDLLKTWGSSGNSVVIVALREVSADSEYSKNPYRIIAMFAIQDSPRTEALYVIKEFESQGIAAYLRTGDNRNTALLHRSISRNQPSDQSESTRIQSLPVCYRLGREIVLRCSRREGRLMCW